MCINERIEISEEGLTLEEGVIGDVYMAKEGGGDLVKKVNFNIAIGNGFDNIKVNLETFLKADLWVE